MAITYDVVNNWIIVTGYAELLPCNFTDLWNADKAGTLSLHARVGIAGVDGAGVAVDRAERPTDYVILGGASGDLFITVANWNLMTNATIDIIGTDRDGAPQTDSVVVNANGNFNSALWFATITDTQVTVFNTPGGGSFDYDLTQGQWGVVWLQNTAQFQLDCRLVIGWPGTPTWFADELKQVVISDGAIVGFLGWQIVGQRNSSIRLGRVINVGDKRSTDGCAVLSLETTFALPRPIFTYSAPTDLQVYSSTFCAVADAMIEPGAVPTGRFWNCSLAGNVALRSPQVDIFNLYATSFGNLAISIAGGTYDRLSITDVNYLAFVNNPIVALLSNVYTRGIAIEILFCTAAATTYLLNIDSDNWVIKMDDVAGIAYRQYHFNLRVVGSAGTGIVGATVNMDDRFGANVFNVVTGAGGDIAEQTVTYQMYPQGNPSVPTTYSPHTVTISLAGYITRTIIYTMDRQREEIEELLPKGLKKTVEGHLLIEINSVGDLLRIAP